MSEYQYYEFAAVDRPLTPREQAELRERSTRARITPSSFVNEYHWGDLKGDPLDWVERYFDAHVYSANWGSCRLLLRLPRAALDKDVLDDFCALPRSRHATAFAARPTPQHWILDWSQDDDSGENERFWRVRLPHAGMARGAPKTLPTPPSQLVSNAETDGPTASDAVVRCISPSKLNKSERS